MKNQIKEKGRTVIEEAKANLLAHFGGAVIARKVSLPAYVWFSIQAHADANYFGDTDESIHHMFDDANLHRVNFGIPLALRDENNQPMVKAKRRTV